MRHLPGNGAHPGERWARESAENGPGAGIVEWHNEKETAFVAANQTVYQDREHPSHVLLPVLPGFGAKKP
jgi:hypothetical protein